MSTRVLVPSGALGLGFDPKALALGIERSPDAICIDGGSTDSGPFYLGTGTSKYSRATTKAEWRELMMARAEASVPLIIGSCGTCGTGATVDWMLDITIEIARELGQEVKVATLRSDQPQQRVRDALDAGQIFPLEPAPHISATTIDACTNIVALAGAEQIGAALNTGADIVLAGRTTDTAVISALPLLRGEHQGGAWHGAKIAECGALCSTVPTSGVVMVEFDEDGFTVEALAEDARCTPYSVSSHMLYENADPYVLYEPGGHLNVSNACYSALDDARVRVTGSEWHDAKDYTVKLEGTIVAGYQTTILALLRDAHYVANARAWVTKLTAFLKDNIAKRMDLLDTEYDLEFRLIGVDATLGELEAKTALPTEVGVLGIITAQSQETASEIGRLVNPWVLHYPLTQHEELPTFAFPHSPAHSDRGALFEFSLNHVLKLDDPLSAFTLDVTTVSQ
ncbi:MAG: acyclic terpene utilization AtuA family protein [Chromatiales bacterium]|jgi:hypothetical protein|nr:acyclic terpene utilization AtuA family protein [Chromatiales bacterium]